MSEWGIKGRKGEMADAGEKKEIGRGLGGVDRVVH